MIVVDASAVLELLLRTEKAVALDALLLNGLETMHAPHLLDVEIVQTLRRLVLGAQLTGSRAAQAIDDFTQLVIERHAHTDLLARAWQLRSSITAYDAMYVALAEALDAPLVSCDTRLGRAHGHGATIRIV
ncbi:MAG: type II toxin-antitoxin system VapC family toxin [Gammaproteobacteria bacterium]|nr:type II toxin-antitoxin system VapC family toxin [Gammaproteobacteria bacterium]